MEEVKVNKSELLSKVRSNREKHEREYKEAVANFRESAIERLREHLSQAEKGDKIEVALGLNEPQSYLDDYDQIISMLEMSADNIITLLHYEFQQYVMDKWTWKASFNTSNSMLSATALSYKSKRT